MKARSRRNAAQQLSPVSIERAGRTQAKPAEIDNEMGIAHPSRSCWHQYSSSGMRPRVTKCETLKPCSMSLYQSTFASEIATTQKPPPVVTPR